MHIDTMEVLRAQPAIFDAYHRHLNRKRLILAFIASWAVTLAALFGLLGDVLQTVFATLTIVWFFSIGYAHQRGLLLPAVLFWAAVFKIRVRR